MASGYDNNKSWPRKICKTNSQTSDKKMGWPNYLVYQRLEKGLIVILPYKGDLTCCGNWSGITIRRIAEQIFIIRNIIEHTVKWKYSCWRWERVDSGHQEPLSWKFMRYYGIPEKLILLYSDNNCAVVAPNGTSEWFKVKQGCSMSGFLLTPM